MNKELVNISQEFDFFKTNKFLRKSNIKSRFIFIFIFITLNIYQFRGLIYTEFTEHKALIDNQVNSSRVNLSLLRVNLEEKNFIEAQNKLILLSQFNSLSVNDKILDILLKYSDKYSYSKEFTLLVTPYLFDVLNKDSIETKYIRSLEKKKIIFNFNILKEVNKKEDYEKMKNELIKKSTILINGLKDNELTTKIQEVDLPNYILNH